MAGREACYGLLGSFVEQQADLDGMKRLAEALNDIPRQIQTIISQVTLQITLGNYAVARQTAETGLKLALSLQTGNCSLQAGCLTSLGVALNKSGDFENSLSSHKEALHIYRELGEAKGEALSLRCLADCLKDMGQSVLAQEYAEQSCALYHTIGEQSGQAHCFNILGIVTSDLAQARIYYEQSLLIFQTVGDYAWQANLYNNLGLVYWRMGLYGKARDYLEQAVQTVRDIRGHSSLASFLESLGRIYIELGKYDEAQHVLTEGCDLSREIGDRLSESMYLMMLGRVALAGGKLEKARDLIQLARDMQRSMGTPGYLVTSLAWLGAVFLKMGDYKSARLFSEQAIAQLELTGRVSEYPSQDVWWFHYQILKSELLRAARNFDPTMHMEDLVLDEPAWKCLRNARDSMLAGIATLSDNGLRRNYLNKVKFNREILFEWALFSVKRLEMGDFPKPLEELGPEPETEFSTESVHTHVRLKRLLDISLQMNATLNPDTLLDFVIDNVIELSGAERGFLAFVQETGELDFKVERGMDQVEIKISDYPQIQSVLEQVIQARTPVLLEYADGQEALTEGLRNQLTQRSAICLPLLRRSELIGMIYADNHCISGRFIQADVDLLSIFANQAATAIENARLFRERERRITELSILDEISRSLSSTLNLDELLETVYQQVGRLFDVTNFHIATYQEGDTEWVGAYQMDQGQRQPMVRHELGLGLTGYILRNRLPILLHSSAESRSFKEAHGIPPVGALAESWMGVPLIAADKVVGVMAIQSYECDHLFDDHALNLFSTISPQVAIAIRNTRLYEEKSRANRDLESFSYSVSHDLRAPIRAINGFSSILLENHYDQLDDEGKQYLKRVNAAGLRMGVLIDDILRLSRVTRGEIWRGLLDLSQMAQAVISDLQNTSQDRQVEVLIAPDLKVNADPNLLRIVLENLLGNAWKFTQKHPTARIELGVTKKDDQTTYFVRDDGAGFDMAYAAKLFGAFQRLHPATEFDGTGIGLATVQRIIQRHGGSIWAEAAPEQGATFYFTLPG